MASSAIYTPASIGSLRSDSATYGADSTLWLDRVLAAVLLVILAPLLIVTVFAIGLTSPGPILFRQVRIGHGGQKFEVFKFRTMQMDAEQRLSQLLARNPRAAAEWRRDQKLRNDPRVTPIGEFLRKSSIDELPQLFNVLLGDMRLVGPRPIVDNERVKYGRYFSNYCSVRPGITGLWQISGRNDVSYQRRVAYDVLYSKQRSLLFDAMILIATIPCVLRRQGSY